MKGYKSGANGLTFYCDANDFSKLWMIIRDFFALKDIW